jgi:hypothetical protein
MPIADLCGPTFTGAILDRLLHSAYKVHYARP